MYRSLLLSLLACLITAASSLASADIRLPHLVSDGMVLQRDVVVPIWGWADPGETVTLLFQEQRYTTQANDQGEWHIALPKMSAGGPYTLELLGNNRIQLNNILIGDVWLASGQSNMELSMARTEPLYREEIARANNPNIRYFHVPNRYQFHAPEQDLEDGEWQSITPDTIRSISAVVYFYAQALNERYGIPIGVINASLGGSPVEAWLSEEALEDFPHHLAEAKRFRDDQLVADITAADQERGQNWRDERDHKDQGYGNGKLPWAAIDLDHSTWDTITLPASWPADPEQTASGVWWLRKTFNVPAEWAGKPALLNLGKLVDADHTYLNGQLVGHTGYRYPPRWYHLPEGVLKAGSNTLAVRLTSERGKPAFIRDKEYSLSWNNQHIDLSGTWHYRQGAAMPPLDGPTFIRWKPLGLYNGMIAPLTRFPIKGVIWYQGESNVGRAEEYTRSFPALIQDWRRSWEQTDLPFLFVQLANYQEARPEPGDSDWARLREAQQSALALPHTGMAVAIDIGEWNDIHPLNKRAVGERLAAAAHAVAYGEQQAISSGPLLQSDRIKGRRIELRFEHTQGGLASCDGSPLRHVAIAGDDRQFVWAETRIRSNRLEVWHPSIRKPQAVRYAWADTPEGANLCNGAGLPAAPFRTDNWR